MKVHVEPESRKGLAQLLARFNDPCVFICHELPPARDLLRGPDGQATHISIPRQPWVAMAMSGKDVEGLGSKLELECEGIKYLVYAKDPTNLPDLEIAVDGYSISVRPVAP